jgi:hypothetical protein
MSKYHKAFQGFVKVFTGAKQPGVKGSSTTIIGTKPNVGNLKFNKDTIDKLTKTTDAYVTKAGSVDPGLKKALRDSGSKSLQKTDNILRKKKADARIIEKRNEESKKMFKKVESKKDGGRMGLKKGSKFPDHSGDGKITQKDILMAKGVIPKTKSKSKKKFI